MIELNSQDLIRFYNQSIIAVADFLQIDVNNEDIVAVYNLIRTENIELFRKLNEFINSYDAYQTEVIRLDEIQIFNLEGEDEQKILLQNAMSNRNEKRDALILALNN